MGKRLPARYRLGPWTVDPELNLVERDGSTERLEPICMDVLVHLIEQAPRVVSGDELLDRFWPDTHTEASTIHRRIAQIRRALGDSARQSKFVETVPKRGYRIVAEVAVLEPVPPDGAQPSAPAGPAGDEAASSLSRRDTAVTPTRVVVAILIVIAAFGSWALVSRGARTDVEKAAASNPAEATTRLGMARIAVLPFREIGTGAPTNGGLGAAFHEDVLNRLARVSGLEVISRASVVRFAEDGSLRAESAQRLGATHALEGSVLDEQDRVRIHLQLVDVHSDTVLWAESYDGSHRERFELQSEVARAVAAQIGGALGAAGSLDVEVAPPQDLEAYDLLTEARGELRLGSVQSAERAESLLEQAIERDPRLAQAHALLAGSLVRQARFGADWDGIRTRAADAIGRALELDPASGTAHLVLAQMADWEGEPQRAEQHYRRAIELEPNHSDAHLFYANSLANLASRYEDALPYVDRALRLDPLSPEAHEVRIFVLMNLGRVEEALESWQRGLELAPRDLDMLRVGLSVMIGNSDLFGVLGLMAELIELDPENVLHLTYPVGVLVALGELDAAQRWIDRARGVSPTHERVFDNQLLIDLAAHDTSAVGALLDRWRSMNSSRRLDKVFDGMSTPFETRVRTHHLTLQANDAHRDGRRADERVLRTSAVETLGDVLRTADGSLRIIEDNIDLAVTHARNLRLLGREVEATAVLDAVIEFDDPFRETGTYTFQALMMRGDVDAALEFGRDGGVGIGGLEEIHDNALGIYRLDVTEERWLAFYEAATAGIAAIVARIRAELPALLEG